MQTWTKIREGYKKFADFNPQDLGVWYLPLFFIVILLSQMFVAFTPKWLHIPIGGALLLWANWSGIREKWENQKRRLRGHDPEITDITKT